MAVETDHGSTAVTTSAGPAEEPRVLISATQELPGTPALKVLTTADYKAAGACLTECFASDPVVTYPLDAPDAADWPAAQRQELFERMFECTVYAHIMRGVAVGVPSVREPGAFDAVALWMPPGRNMDDPLTMLRSGLWRLRWAYSPQGRARFYDEFLPLLHRVKAEVLAERDDHSWYLVYLGTREAARGRGLARRLIRFGTEQADAQNRATYLESSHRANVPYYQRLGFKIARTIALKDGDKCEMDVMVREPGAARV